MPGPMLMTARHFAKPAPIFAYSCRRSRRPSRPSVTSSPGAPASGFEPLSTLMPGMTRNVSFIREIRGTLRVVRAAASPGRELLQVGFVAGPNANTHRRAMRRDEHGQPSEALDEGEAAEVEAREGRDTVRRRARP